MHPNQLTIQYYDKNNFYEAQQFNNFYLLKIWFLILEMYYTPFIFLINDLVINTRLTWITFPIPSLNLT